MASSKTRTLFVIDTLIAIAFAAAGMSAVAFLIPYSAIDFATSSAAPTFLGLAYGTWRTMHLYSGLTMILGGTVHFAMHWAWMLRAAKSIIPGAKGAEPRVTQAAQLPVLAEEAHDVQ